MKKLLACILAGSMLFASSPDTYALPEYPYKELIPPVYDDIRPLSSPEGDLTFIVQAEGLYGMLDADGKELLACQYDFIISDNWEPEFLCASIDGQPLLMDENLNQVSSDMLFLAPDKVLFKDEKDGLWGVTDQNGNEVIGYQYRGIGSIYPDEEGGWRLVAYTQTDFVVLNEKGETLFATELMDVTYPAGFYAYLFHDWLITADYPAGAGLPSYYNVYDISTGNHLASSDNYGPMANLLKPSDDGLVFTVNQEFVADTESNILLEKGQFDSISAFVKGKALASKDGQEYIIDTAGNILANWQSAPRTMLEQLETVIHTINPEQEDIFMSGSDGSVHVEPPFGYIILQKDGVTGVWDANGNEILPPVYDYIITAGEGRFIVEKEEECALVAAGGEILIPFGHYNYIYHVFGDFFCGQKGYVSSIINISTGEKPGSNYASALPILNSGLGYDSFLMVAGTRQGTQGLFNIDGTEIVPIGAYDHFLSLTNNQYVGVKKNGKQGYIVIEAPLYTPVFATALVEEELETAARAGLIPLYQVSNFQNTLTRDEFCGILENILIQKTGRTARELVFQTITQNSHKHQGITYQYQQWSFSPLLALMPQDIYDHHNAARLYPFMIAPQTDGVLFRPDELITLEEICELLEALAAALDTAPPDRSLFLMAETEKPDQPATWEDAVLTAYRFYKNL